MALKFKCSNCDQDVVASIAKVGQIAKCKECGKEQTIPSDAESFTEKRPVTPSDPPPSKSQSRIVSNSKYPSLNFIKSTLSGILMVWLCIGVLSNTVIAISFGNFADSFWLGFFIFLVSNGISIVSYVLLRAIPELVDVVLNITMDLRAIRQMLEQKSQQ